MFRPRQVTKRQETLTKNDANKILARDTVENISPPIVYKVVDVVMNSPRIGRKKLDSYLYSCAYAIGLKTNIIIDDEEILAGDV